MTNHVKKPSAKKKTATPTVKKVAASSGKPAPKKAKLVAAKTKKPAAKKKG